TSRIRPRSMAAVVGDAPSIIELFETVDRVAATTCTLLVSGEGGTGKELVARALHETSARRARPFVVVNCGATGEASLDRELFGHVRDALGARTTKLGRIAAAQGGTLFLDEVAELSPSLQVKLLRVLEGQEYCPAGEMRAVKVDVRFVA